MILSLILAGALVGWPQAGTSVLGQQGGAIGGQPSNTYQWKAPAGAPGANPWPFYGDPLVGPRELVCYKAEWLYIGTAKVWYPGVCWNQRIHRRYVH